MDICQLIEQDHTEALGLARRLTQTEDPLLAKDLYRSLRDLLSAHARSEESVAYGALDLLADPELIRRTCEGEVAHNLCDHLLAKMTRGRADHPGWQARARVLMQVLQRHFDEETEDLLVQLRTRFDTEQRSALGRRFATRRAVLLRRRA